MTRSALVLYYTLPTAHKIAWLRAGSHECLSSHYFTIVESCKQLYLHCVSSGICGYNFDMGSRDRTVWLIAIGLYGLAVVLLVVGLDTYPGYTVNWENNTLQGLFPFVDQPSLDPFHLHEGLMTDGGSSPWVVFPAWLAFGIAGPSLLAMRLPVALLAALAVPLLYFLTRKLYGKLPGADQRLREPVSV